MNPSYPSILFDVLAVLHGYAFEFSGGNNPDGRIVSIEKEKDVVTAISNNFECIIPPPRHWFDIALMFNEQLIYCNIKISTGKTDNAKQKKGIVHSLTNLHEKSIRNNMNFNKMHQLIHDHALDSRVYEREYYYIYLDKKDKSVIIRSMCDIMHFQSNPCNFLQINWDAEKKRTNIDATDDLTESKKRILGTIAQSIKKFVDSSNDFMNAYLPNNDLGT